MAVEIVMPKLGMAMKEGTVSIWNKQVGDPVVKGELIASINSEKIEMEIESPAEGTLLDIIVPEGQGVPPGTVICYIGDAGEQITRVEQNLETAKTEVAAAATITKQPQSSAGKASNGRLKISPVARKMAEAAGLDLNTIQGTGPGGRITKEDVQQAIDGGCSIEPPKQNEMVNSLADSVEQAQKLPVTGMRKVIAERMQESLQSSAQLTLTMKVDVTDLMALQKQIGETVQARYETKLTVTDFVARAVVLSLGQHKEMNSAYIDDQIHIFDHVHLGMAVALEKGLVVPVIRHAQNDSLVQLAKNMKTLAERARNGQLGSDEMKGSTFTISNLGAYGVEHFTPILNSPEAGILGVGAAYDTPLYKGEELQRRTILPLSLTFDHRVLDGAPAAAFLRTIKRYLEEPFMMLV
ncbi:dihydrolipoamide acetyltransferase family protein [Priestia abyssalis]|uniref:dihydrolipoamide acetyltransferase family protein n=1 Tax=Priestia abyssalis TaxID=1221450 RepID=UPI0009951F4F|nr:dihydrolipoamide acetyltransferase family protein [Priestia abyssalis]